MALLALIGLLALRELGRMISWTLAPLFILVCLGMLWTGSSKIVMGRGSIEWEAVGLLLALAGGVLGLTVFRGESQRPFRLLLGFLWVAAPLRAILAMHGLRFSPETPISWSWESPILMAILPIWAGDTAAILVGRVAGKMPLAPKISPKKTWEGAIGNFLACVALAMALAEPLGFSLLQGALTGVACGVFGQLGDLFESWLKRESGMKDSGSLLPGHGGILDRIDSLLFTAPVVFAILALIK